MITLVLIRTIVFDGFGLYGAWCFSQHLVGWAERICPPDEKPFDQEQD